MIYVAFALTVAVIVILDASLLYVVWTAEKILP